MSETVQKRNMPVTELGLCICEIFKLEIFSKNLHLNLRTVTVLVSIKNHNAVKFRTYNDSGVNIERKRTHRL